MARGTISIAVLLLLTVSVGVFLSEGKYFRSDFLGYSAIGADGNWNTTSAKSLQSLSKKVNTVSSRADSFAKQVDSIQSNMAALKAQLEEEMKSIENLRQSAHGNTGPLSAYVGVGARQNGGPNRRKFVSYTPSKWETMWVNNVQNWTDDEEICKVLMDDQAEYMHDFLNLTCNKRLGPDWCGMDDTILPLYYKHSDRTEFHLQFAMPPEATEYALKAGPPKAIYPGPEHEHIVSKFVFLDELTGEEYVEYIEPLVSHLRHPLAICVSGGVKKSVTMATFRGYVIPPPRPRAKRNLYFDAGASSWNMGAGGPSLSFFTTIWNRHNITFDRIQAYEMTTTPQKFYSTVPAVYQERTIYRMSAVSSTPENETINNPFIPHDIQRVTDQDDYIFFKLDIDSPEIEEGSVRYILESEERIVDEIAWEHHGMLYETRRIFILAVFFILVLILILTFVLSLKWLEII